MIFVPRIAQESENLIMILADLVAVDLGKTMDEMIGKGDVGRKTDPGNATRLVAALIGPRGKNNVNQKERCMPAEVLVVTLNPPW